MLHSFSARQLYDLLFDLYSERGQPSLLFPGQLLIMMRMMIMMAKPNPLCFFQLMSLSSTNEPWINVCLMGAGKKDQHHRVKLMVSMC